MKTAPDDGRGTADSHRRALTLVELLVVIAIIALLAAVLLPALFSAKANSKQLACLNNLCQMETAFQMYAADNGGYLTQNVPLVNGQNSTAGTNAWVYGNMKNVNDGTNAVPIQTGEQYPYTPQTRAYRCPADGIVDNNLPRVRSYSMNSWIGSRDMDELEDENRFRIFLKESDLAAGGPSSVWVQMDEHTASLDDGWFEVTMNDSAPFVNLPATRHQNAYCQNFADGHADVCHLRTAAAQIPETQAQAFAEYVSAGFAATNTDWIKLKQVTTSP